MNQAEDNLLRELRENIEQDIDVYLDTAISSRSQGYLHATAAADLCDKVAKRFREYNTQHETLYSNEELQGLSLGRSYRK